MDVIRPGDGFGMGSRAGTRERRGREEPDLVQLGCQLRLGDVGGAVLF